MEIFRRLGIEASSVKGRGNTFLVGKGVWVFPEGICPFCSEHIFSKKIWKIDKGRLVGVWKVVTSGRGKNKKYTIVFEDPTDVWGIHPHVFDRTGNICMGAGRGRAESGEQALFWGMSVRGGMFPQYGKKSRWFKWLYDTWGHECRYDMRGVTVRRRAARAVRAEAR